jgi:hypothetical protein
MNERWAAAAAIILLCIPLSCTARLAVQHGDPDPPQWPKQYSVSCIHCFDICDCKRLRDCLLVSACVACMYESCCGHVAPLCAVSLQVKFTFSIPYIKLYQKDGLTCAIPGVAVQRLTGTHGTLLRCLKPY